MSEPIGGEWVTTDEAPSEIDALKSVVSDLSTRVEAIEAKSGIVRLDTTTDNAPVFLSEGARGDALLAKSVEADAKKSAKDEYDAALLKAEAAGVLSVDLPAGDVEPEIFGDVEQTASGPVEWSTGGGNSPGGDHEPADAGGMLQAEPVEVDPDFQNEPAVNDLPAPEQAAVDAASQE